MSIRKSFVLHNDSLNVLDEMTNEQAGLLFKAIKSHQLNEVVNHDVLTRVALSQFINQFDRDNIKYQTTVERNKINGSKGGRPLKPKITQDNPKKPSGLIDNPTEPKKPDNDNVNDNDNGNGNVNGNNLLKLSSNELDQPVKKPSGLIFDHWSFVMDKNKTTKFTAQRKKAIESRLKNGYSVNDIFLAITNCAKSKFHMGDNNDGKLYNDLTLICRNDTKLESFRDMTNTSKADFQLNKDRQDINDFVNDHD